MRTLSLKTTAAKSIFPTFPDCSPHPEPNFHQLRSPANAAPLAPPPTEKPSAPRRNPPPREAREASSGQRAGSYLLMITAPLYMTEKVGIITWSPGGLSRTAGRQQLPQPSASSHMMLPVCAQPASNSTKTDCPLKTSPPSPTRLISYITKVTGEKKNKKNKTLKQSGALRLEVIVRADYLSHIFHYRAKFLTFQSLFGTVV